MLKFYFFRKTFYFNYLAIYSPSLFDSMILCVEKCPDSQFNSVSDMQTWCNTNDIQLCRYDIAIANYVNGTDRGNTCPQLPVLEQYVFADLNFSKFNDPIKIYGRIWKCSTEHCIAFSDQQTSRKCVSNRNTVDENVLLENLTQYIKFAEVYKP